MEPRTITCQQPWFGEIEKGRKPVEGKPGPEGDFKADEFIMIMDGSVTLDDIARGTPGRKIIQVRIVAIRHYNTLIEYLQGEGWQRTAPQATSFGDAFAKYCQITYEDVLCKEPAHLPRVKGTKHVFVFSSERIAHKGGINALEIRESGLGDDGKIIYY
jgi:ASC-1-like (ASCH) protein